MAYFWLKAFHLIGIVVWFAGLFYLVRLFVYHVEAEQQPEPAKSILQNQYLIMEKRLYKLITTPGMWLTVIMASGLLIVEPQVLQDTWLQIKLVCVSLLVAYHIYCGRILKKLEQGEQTWSSQQFRGLNEVPTLLLVIIVLLAVFKQSLPVSPTISGLIGMTVLMALSIHLYAKKRQQDQLKKDLTYNT